MRFATGAVGNFMGDFIAESIINEFTGDDTPIDIGGSKYISSIISGGFANLVNVRGFKASMLFVGLNKVVFDVVDRTTGGEGFEQDLLVKGFIMDSIRVYFIIQILDQIVKTFTDNKHSLKVNTTFGMNVLKNIFYGIFINVFLYSRMIRNNNNENSESKKVSIS